MGDRHVYHDTQHRERYAMRLDLDYDVTPSEENEVRCKYCGARDLFWQDTGAGKFFLVDGEGEPHACRAKLPTADDFDTI